MNTSILRQALTAGTRAVDKFLEVALAGVADPVVTNVWNLCASDPWRGGRIEVRAALAELPEKG